MFSSLDGSLSIREGAWKLELCPGSGGPTDKMQGTDLSALAKWQLYNMVGDITERYNLYERYPEIAERLKHKLVKYIKDGRSMPGVVQLNYGGKNSWEEINSWMD